MRHRTELSHYDSYAAPDSPHIFSIGGILFATETNGGDLTMVQSERVANQENGSAIELYSIADAQEVIKKTDDVGVEYALGNNNYKRVVILADTRNRIHIHLGPETSIENVLLHRLEGNSRLPVDRYFIEKLQRTTAGRIWALVERNFPGTQPLTSAQKRLYGKIWRFPEDDHITFEEIGFGKRVRFPKQYSRYYNLMKNDGPEIPVDGTEAPTPEQ